MRLVLFFLSGLALAACQKEPLPEPVPPPKPGLEVLWQYPLSPDTADVSGDAWFIWENQLVYTTNFTVPEAQVHCRNAYNGELIWKLEDLYHAGWVDREILSIADKTIACMWDRVYCIQNQTGEYLWKTDVEVLSGNTLDGDPRIYGVGDFVYHAHVTGGTPYYESLTLARAHHATGQWESLFTVLQDQDFHPHLGSVSLWMNPVGDSILLAPFSMLGNLVVHSPQERSDLYAFNLRSRQLEWVLKDYDPLRSGTPIYPPVVSDNRLYINCNKALYCIDLLQPGVIWKREFPSGWGSDIRFNSLKEFGNTILLVSDHTFSAMAISKTDGSTVWENKTAGPAADELTLFEGVLYYTSRATGRLVALDAATGATIWNMQSPNRTSKRPASFSNQNLSIDSEKRLLYVTDYYFIMCVKLPER
ncbi:MAG: PQQ-like beta-propeller repeat protein [Saprospiraceae bacterium]|nr:PQQ-like beta-propeller repeat protein [Saprospiraceae bacterium]